MSRSGYTDDCDDNWAFIRWRGMVKSAIRGKRGQKLLRDLLAALDAMPEKRLITEDLVNEDGEYCALGVLGAKRGIDIEKLDPEEPEQVGAAFDIAPCLAAEIVYENDESWFKHDEKEPYARWQHMRDWAQNQINDPLWRLLRGLRRGYRTRLYGNYSNLLYTVSLPGER